MSENTVSVIIACAGKSTRMGGINKLMFSLDGIPVAVRSMLAFEKLDEVKEIVVCARGEELEEYRSLANQYNVTKLKAAVEGGDTRQQSILHAYNEVSRETCYIAVHDGARPLVSPEKIRLCIKDASVFGAAVLGVPVKDTIKVVDEGLVEDTPDRNKLYITQTPQIFRKDLYVKGINFAIRNELDFTDDCQFVEAVGTKVAVTESDYRNIKITTPEDLAIAQALLKQKNAAVL